MASAPALTPTTRSPVQKSCTRGEILGLPAELALMLVHAVRTQPHDYLLVLSRRPKVDDGVTHGGQAWLRWRPVDSFFPSALAMRRCCKKA
jgi:hypothetical protein